jgi:hypothetical protein
MGGDKGQAELAGVSAGAPETTADGAAGAAYPAHIGSDFADDDVDLEQVLGGGIRKAPVAVTTVPDETGPAAAESAL